MNTMQNFPNEQAIIRYIQSDLDIKTAVIIDQFLFENKPSSNIVNALIKKAQQLEQPSSRPATYIAGTWEWLDGLRKKYKFLERLNIFTSSEKNQYTNSAKLKHPCGIFRHLMAEEVQTILTLDTLCNDVQNLKARLALDYPIALFHLGKKLVDIDIKSFNNLYDISTALDNIVIKRNKTVAELSVKFLECQFKDNLDISPYALTHTYHWLALHYYTEKQYQEALLHLRLCHQVPNGTAHPQNLINRFNEIMNSIMAGEKSGFDPQQKEDCALLYQIIMTRKELNITLPLYHHDKELTLKYLYWINKEETINQIGNDPALSDDSKKELLVELFVRDTKLNPTSNTEPKLEPKTDESNNNNEALSSFETGCEALREKDYAKAAQFFRNAYQTSTYTNTPNVDEILEQLKELELKITDTEEHITDLQAYYHVAMSLGEHESKSKKNFLGLSKNENVKLAKLAKNFPEHLITFLFAEKNMGNQRKADLFKIALQSIQKHKDIEKMSIEKTIKGFLKSEVSLENTESELSSFNVDESSFNNNA